jgi:L-ascorbate metabolism protein UlaG (beta-lactamase superfamily)
VSTDTVTWCGHSTVAVRFGDVRLVTDPVLRRRVGFLGWGGEWPRSRNLTSGTAAVLVSHLHRDHLDLPSLARFDAGTRLIVPAGAGPLVRRAARGPVTEVGVGDVVTVAGVEVRAVHAEHDGSRRGGRITRYFAGGLHAPALGYVLTAGSCVYFAGDTDTFPGMADLAPRVDLALLPVGGWGLTLGPGHLDPARAAAALHLTGARRGVPIHWGGLRLPALWRLYPHLFRNPGEDFANHARTAAPHADVVVATPGEPVAAQRP